MANDYATIEDLYQLVDLDPEKYSTIMQFMLDSAAKHIDNVTKRKQDGWLADTTATARLFTGSGNELIEIDDNVAVTAVGFKYNFDDATYTTMTTSDYIALAGTPKKPEFNKTPYTMLMINPNGDYGYWPKVTVFGDTGFWSSTVDKTSILPLYPSIQVTAKWGYAATVPDVIKHCTIIQATRYVKRAQGAYGDALANTDLGTMAFVRKMDNDIASMLKDGGLIRMSV